MRNTTRVRNFFLLMGFVIVIGFSFSHCKGKSSQKTKLVIAARGGSHVKAIEAVKEIFEKENQVLIEILGLKGSTLKQKISLNAKNTKGSFDIIMIDDPWMPEFVEAKILTPLSELNIKPDDDFILASLNLGKSPYKTGNLYALPFAGNVQLFFYNKKLFADGKFQAPNTWQEVLTIAQEVQKNENALGYVIRGQQGNPIVSDFLPILWAFGGNVFNNNWQPIVNNMQAKRALHFYKELLKTGANYEKADLVHSVAAGKAAMSLGWPSWYISGENTQAEYSPIPSKETKTSSSKATGMIGNWLMGIPTNSPNKKLAGKFLAFITSSEIQKKMATDGGVPTRKSVYLDKELSAKYKHFPTQLKALQNSVARARTPKWSQVETALGAELSAAVSETKSVEEALADAQKKIAKIME